MPKKHSPGKYFLCIAYALFCGVGTAYLALSLFNNAEVKLVSRFPAVASRGQQATAISVAVVASSAPVSVVPVVDTLKSASTTTTLAFVGDIMLDRGVKQSVLKNSAGDYNSVFSDISRIKDSDILVGNLEGPVSDRGFDMKNSYSFRMAPAVVPVLAAQGFDVLSVANNHASDWGKPAFADTLVKFQNSGIALVGGGNSLVEAGQVKIIEKNGVKFGFLSFSDVGPNWLKAGSTTPGILIAGDPETPDIIRQASTACDVLSVSFHFGNEYETSPSWRQRELAQMAIDNGAKIIVGTHPHVVEPVEMYRGGVIMYSLGNFVFDQYFSTSTMNGLVVKVHMKGKEIDSVEKLNAKLDPSFRVRVE